MGQLKKGLSNLNSTQLLAKASFIVERMTGNPAFPDPTPSLTVIADAIAALQEAYVAALDKGVLALATRRMRHTELRLLLNQLAGYVSSVAGGNELAILSSGFQVVRRGTPAAEPAMPVDVRATISDHAGRASLSWKPVDAALAYQVQWTSGDPGGEEGWNMVAWSTRSSRTVNGLPSGKVAHFRVAAYGTAGVGPWSQVASTLVK